MVSSDNQDKLVAWLCDKIGLVSTPNIRCIGSLRGTEIVGVVGFDNYNGSSIMMHAAGGPGWVSSGLPYAVFHYAFVMCKSNMVIGLVPSGNVQAIRFNTHVGFKTVLNLEGAHPDGSLLLMTMTTGECRFLNKERYGKKVQASASA